MEGGRWEGGAWEREPSLGGGSSGRGPSRRGRWRFLPTRRTVLLGALAGFTTACGLVLAGYLLVDIPEPKSAAAAQGNVFLYSDGSQLARVGPVNRENIPLDQVPRTVREAVLAAEDRDFYDSAEVDLAAMVRAAWNMLRGEGTQSGSTITQQYVKNYYLDQEQTLSRKVRELFIAVRLGQEVSKDEILEGYLNTSYFGRNAYGIQAAAHAYYGKEASQLTTAEGAYLAALLNAPSVYDVGASPDNRPAAVARWEYVLDGMVEQGWLSAAERATLRFPDPLPVAPPADLSGQRGYLVEAVEEYLLSTGVVDEQQLARGGLRVTTTIDPGRQAALTRAVEEQLLELLEPGERPEDGYVRVGASSVDVATGRVVAMYGGRDYTTEYVNNATRRDYQAASTFKPFVYAAALEHGARTLQGERVGPDTVYDGDSGREVLSAEGRGTGWAPENEGEEDYGEVTVAEAMNSSVNAVFAQLGVDVGVDRVRETAVAVGIPEDTPGLAGAEASISLGTATPSTLDLARAYATLAAHGVRREVVLVEEVTVGGRELPLPEVPSSSTSSSGGSAEGERVLSREAADGTTALLRRVVEEGTGMAASALGRPAAGKTGTAEDDRAAWFAGYTPELSTVVAVFGQDPVTGEQRSLYGAAGLERLNGGGFPARIWAQYMTRALAWQPVTEFELRGPLPEGDGDRHGDGDGDRARERREEEREEQRARGEGQRELPGGEARENDPGDGFTGGAGPGSGEGGGAVPPDAGSASPPPSSSTSVPPPSVPSLPWPDAPGGGGSSGGQEAVPPSGGGDGGSTPATPAPGSGGSLLPPPLRPDA
ncbi:transglycosylase domain-containing protein [Streptomyces sp. 4N509B]|uniref:transglycosylase domain-containing protein n=1 Tax=Streptomyces sp. 4N509B TaxID=3457413 RepID=UPI003FD4C0C7